MIIQYRLAALAAGAAFVCPLAAAQSVVDGASQGIAPITSIATMTNHLQRTPIALAGAALASGVTVMAICSATRAPAAMATPHGTVTDGVRGAASLGAAVSGEQLEGERGKADTTSNDARLHGVVSGNSAINVATGGNSIDTGSFANMAGLPVVIQNTGANVLIQNSTIVNVQFR